MSKNEPIQKHLKIKGRVQGVGFRYFTVKQAEDLGLTGWVKNIADGSVDVVIEGSKKQIEQMISRLHKGPVSARVSDVIEIKQKEAQENYTTFSVRR